MKKLLLGSFASSALVGHVVAADLPGGLPHSPPPATPIAFSWTGCYVGSHSGLAAGHTKWTDALPLGTIDATMTGQTANTDMSGAIFGAQVGCDYQFFGKFVIGVDASVSASTVTGTNMDQFNSTWTLLTQNDWIGSVSGRIGAGVDRLLIYTKAGVAWAHNNFEIDNTAILDGRPSTTRIGWIIGSGIEFSLAPCWSVFVEADYYKFGDSNVFFPGDVINPTPSFTVKTSQTVETLKLGVNFRLGAGPVAGSY
jgi:outer membrane immunogenic protein